MPRPCRECRLSRMGDVGDDTTHVERVEAVLTTVRRWLSTERSWTQNAKLPRVGHALTLNEAFVQSHMPCCCKKERDAHLTALQEMSVACGLPRSRTIDRLGVALHQWNSAPGRTHHDVLTALDQALLAIRQPANLTEVP